MAEISYNKELEKKLLMQLKSVISELPHYVNVYFLGIAQTAAPRTRVGYAYDIKYFFEFLHETNPDLGKKEIKEITLGDLENLTALDFEEYLNYLSLYEKNGRTYTNDARGKKRKMSALRTFFSYMYKHDMLSQNVTEKVDMPKIRDKAIIRMDTDEVANFLDTVEYGNKLTKKQLESHEKLKVRDLALLTLMLGTGIRVSECVGLNLKDIDFNNARIKVTRKGGYEAYVFFGHEAEVALQDYLAEREKIEALPGHENALFLSSQRKRIGVRAVENLVKKYATVTTPTKHITPHKLRSTYGTALYNETNDIYLVADVLGHKDVNTTKKHYADMDQERKYKAKDRVILRKDDE